MFVPFDIISPSARIWIYQSDKKLADENLSFARSFFENYCKDWKAHGQPLRSSFDIRANHFIILAADESYNTTSGCSVDDSVRAIKEIEKHTGLVFFNRNLIPFLLNNEVALLDLSRLKENYAHGIWNQSTLTFNNLITTKSQLDHDWIVPAGNTWLKRYVSPETVKT
jgi:hypothetical protein